MSREAAEHFCPACPKAERTASATARSMSAAAVTTSAFFPDVSAYTSSDGPPSGEQPRGLDRPGEQHPRDVGVGDQVAPDLVLRDPEHLEHVGVDARVAAARCGPPRRRPRRSVGSAGPA